MQSRISWTRAWSSALGQAADSFWPDMVRLAWVVCVVEESRSENARVHCGCSPRRVFVEEQSGDLAMQIGSSTGGQGKKRRGRLAQVLSGVGWQKGAEFIRRPAYLMQQGELGLSKVPSWGTKLAPKKHLIQQSKTNLEPTTTHGSRLDRCLQPRRHHAPACIALEKPLIPISTPRFSSNKHSKCRPIFGESQSAIPFPPQTRQSVCCRPDVVNSHAHASASM